MIKGECGLYLTIFVTPLSHENRLLFLHPQWKHSKRVRVHSIITKRFNVFTFLFEEEGSLALTPTFFFSHCNMFSSERLLFELSSCFSNGAIRSLLVTFTVVGCTIVRFFVLTLLFLESAKVSCGQSFGILSLKMSEI